MAGAIIGKVSENGGGAVSGAVVRLYLRSTGALLASTTTNSVGYYWFTALDHTDTANFFVVAFDPAGGTQYNAEILDLLTPVESTNRSLTNAGGFDNSAFGTAEVSSFVDPYWSNVVLLISGNGANGSTTFTDLSDSAHTITSSGAAISTSQSNYGGSSINIGTSGYLQVANHADFDFGSGDFTVELWSRRLFGDAASMVGKGATPTTSPFYLATLTNRPTLARIWNGSSTVDAQSGAISFNTLEWTHFAMSRNGTTLRAFVNGTERASATVSGAVGTNTTELRIGKVGSASGMDGHFGWVRITKGVGRYTATFTPQDHYPLA
jgi:hypothetical protein